MFVSIPDFHRIVFKMQILFAIGLSVAVLVQPTSILQCVHLKSKKMNKTPSADKTASAGKAEPEEKIDAASAGKTENLTEKKTATEEKTDKATG